MLALALLLVPQQSLELTPPGFERRANAIAFRPGGDLLVCDAADGSVWGLSNVFSGDRTQVRAKRVAAGLDRPSALCLVGERIFVLQRQELTELIDLDNDGATDTYSCLCAAWDVGKDPAESVRGLGYAAGWFTTTLASGEKIRIALENGRKESAPAGSEAFLRVAIPHYAGQTCRPEERGLVRECFEEIEGVRQACKLRFSEDECVAAGPDGALYAGRGASVRKLKYGEGSTFDLLAVHARTNGFELEFTEPLAPGFGWDPSLWSADSHKVLSASVSADRKHVELEIAGLEAGTTVHLRALGPVPSENGAQAWSPEAWYSLQRVPKDRPVTVLAQPKLEPEPGWTSLFDGKSAAQWRGYKQQELPQGWVVEDGVLVCKGGGGDIVTREEYADFELALEWKISEGGNSGIFFHASEDHGYVWETAPEMQILDDARHPDGKNPKTSAGSNYALIAPPPGVTRPVGCWNQVRLLVRGSHVEHWQNGVKLLEYELWTPEWKAQVAASKFAKMPDYGLNKTGRIALQDHGDPVWFRDIRIRPLVR